MQLLHVCFITKSLTVVYVTLMYHESAKSQHLLTEKKKKKKGLGVHNYPYF